MDYTKFLLNDLIELAGHFWPSNEVHQTFMDRDKPESNNRYQTRKWSERVWTYYGQALDHTTNPPFPFPPFYLLSPLDKGWAFRALDGNTLSAVGADAQWCPRTFDVSIWMHVAP